jgi:hypothetical protein
MPEDGFLDNHRCENLISQLSLKLNTDTSLAIVFWNIMSCSIIDIYKGFGGICGLHLQEEEMAFTPKVQEAGSSQATDPPDFPAFHKAVIVIVGSM